MLIGFVGIQLLNRAHHIETKVFVKPTNGGLLVHYHSHVDNRYKRGLLTTMLDCAYCIQILGGLVVGLLAIGIMVLELEFR